MNNTELWVDKHNPNSIDEMILDSQQKEYFKNIIKSGNMSNIILCGIQGSGKCLDYDEEIEVYVNKHTYNLLTS